MGVQNHAIRVLDPKQALLQQSVAMPFGSGFLAFRINSLSGCVSQHKHQLRDGIVRQVAIAASGAGNEIALSVVAKTRC